MVGVLASVYSKLQTLYGMQVAAWVNLPKTFTLVLSKGTSFESRVYQVVSKP